MMYVIRLQCIQRDADTTALNSIVTQPKVNMQIFWHIWALWMHSTVLLLHDEPNQAVTVCRFHCQTKDVDIQLYIADRRIAKCCPHERSWLFQTRTSSRQVATKDNRQDKSCSAGGCADTTETCSRGTPRWHRNCCHVDKFEPTTQASQCSPTALQASVQVTRKPQWLNVQCQLHVPWTSRSDDSAVSSASFIDCSFVHYL